MNYREALRQKLAKSRLQALQDQQLPNVLELCLPYQLQFIQDPHKRKVVCSTRRSAKSYALSLALIDAAIKIENGIFCFITLTKESAKKIFRPILRQISDKYQLNLKINSKCEIEFTNGSIIYLAGLDSTDKEMDKIRGNAYNMVVIDEAQAFNQDLREIINDVLDIALAQTQATLLIAGTPGDQMGEHYFYQIAKEDSTETEWKQYFFDWKQNTSIDQTTGLRICDTVQALLDQKIKDNPHFVDSDTYQQEWLGQWVIQKDARMYHSKPVNYIDQLPERENHKPRFVTDQGAVYLLGIDLGYHDATAFVVGVYNPFFDRKLYIIESEKFSKLIISEVAAKIKEYRSKYNFSNMVIDAANLQAVEEMRQIHNLPLMAAEKSGKDAHKALINSDFQTQNVMILKSGNTELIEELNNLIWDPKALAKGIRREDPRREDHLCDALLYLHDMSRHWWYVEPPPELTPQEKQRQHILEHYGRPQAVNGLQGFQKPFWEKPGFNSRF